MRTLGRWGIGIISKLGQPVLCLGSKLAESYCQFAFDASSALKVEEFMDSHATTTARVWLGSATTSATHGLGLGEALAGIRVGESAF